ncbi:MAG: pilus assembly protein PilM [Bacteriovorax sp.]|nr:pilus assembly protein PilM [Bacteriovorax sp.]
MNILAIDIGSYSIKFIEVRPERKNYVLVEKQEIILDEVKPHYPNITVLPDLQKEIISNYIQKKPNDIRIIFQMPNEMLTTRYLEIPGTSKRKTEQIIPFQLEENLPYSLNSAHFSSRINKKSNSFSVLSNITQLNVFKDFFGYFENKETQPSILTSEISIMQAYIDHIRMNETCCIIDLGHKTTKIYFVQDRQIVSNHTSYVAGQAINEVISKTYQISLEDAIIYKHENAFMLNDDQLEAVSPEQKGFALLMKQIFNPMVLDLRRWEIGHRVKFGTNIDKIFILGGSSNINNLDNFINFHTGISVESLPPLLDLKNDYTVHDKNFYLAKMMAISQKTPSSVINFLTGKFQTASNAFISVHSAVFIWVRTTFIALLIILGLTGERFIFLQKQNTAADTKIKALLKRSNLGISSADRKAYDKNPSRVLSIIKKKNKLVTDEVSSILSSQSINALKPLAVLSKTISNNSKVSLENFTADGYNVKAVFSSDDAAELEKMSTLLRGSGLPQLSVSYQSGQKVLTIQFEDRQ